MTLKKPAKLIAIAGACAVAVALPTSLALPGSFGPEADSDPEAAQSAAGVVAQPEPEPELPVGNAENALTSEEGEQVVDGETQASTDDGSSRVVDMIVQLKDGTDTAAALASINSAVAAAYPDASAEVKREYSNTFTGFALSAPIGSMDAIRGVSGVQSAFLDRETQVSDDANGDSDDAGSGSATTASRSQHPDNLSAQIMMHADKVTQKGEGKVVAIIDTGVEMNHPAFSGALHGTPAIDSSKGASLAQQVGKSGTYVSEKFPCGPSWGRARPACTSTRSSPSPTTTRTVTTMPPRRVPTARTSPVSPQPMVIKSWVSPPMLRSSLRRLRAAAVAASPTPRCSQPWMTWLLCILTP